MTDKTQNREAVSLAEFSMLVGMGRDYFSLFLTAFGFYLAAVGVILNTFLDKPRGSDERLVIFGFGALIHVAAILATLLGGRWFRPMASRCKEVGRQLGCPDVYYPGTIGVAYAFLALEVVLLVAWLGGLWRLR